MYKNPNETGPTGARTASLLLLFTLLTLSFAAVAAPSFLFILDGSGSMWGRLAGEPKIVSAKKVLKELVASTPERISTGLMAYGHRRKGDCEDIELLAAPGASRAELDARIDAIGPKGKTPISGALLQAGGLLADQENETTLVLVSDGLETCGGDPCATARQLREQGHKVVIHVVGFDVNADTTRQLQCIAEAGGGRYFAAADGGALRDALSTVQASVVEARPLPAPPPPKVEAVTPTKSVSKRIKIVGPGKVRLKPASWVPMPPYYWRLMEVESGKTGGRVNGDVQRTKAGEYQIVWYQAQHQNTEIPLTEVFTVRPGETTEVPLDTGIRITVPEGVEVPHSWGFSEPGERNWLFTVYGNLDPRLVPAGDYELHWLQKDHASHKTNLGRVHIEAGKLNDVVLDHGILLQPADWLGSPEPYYYKLVDADGRQVASWGILGPQLAAPGEYSLVYRPSQHEHNDIVWGKVTIPEHGMARVPLNSGVKFLHEAGAEPPYRAFFVNLDNGDEIVMSNTWAPLPLPPGRYRIDWWEVQHGSERQTIADEITVEPGTVLELEM